MTKHHLYGTKMSRMDRWTAEEDVILTECYLSKYSQAKMMRILNRGHEGITVRIRHLKKLGTISPLIRNKKGKR